VQAVDQQHQMPLNSSNGTIQMKVSIVILPVKRYTSICSIDGNIHGAANLCCTNVGIDRSMQTAMLLWNSSLHVYKAYATLREKTAIEKHGTDECLLLCPHPSYLDSLPMRPGLTKV